MLKTCGVCGKIHDINKICRRQVTKKKTVANEFRKTNQWKEKSKQIRIRDNYLCQLCLKQKYNTEYQYTYSDIAVHHIVPIHKDYSKRLDSNNLITLCRKHHEMAENGEISKEELLEIINQKI